MDIQIFTDLFAIGLYPIPLVWNIDTKQAEIYPEHKTDIQSGNGKPDLSDVRRWMQKLQNTNAVALKLYPPFFMFDFDLKNSTRKGIFDEWLQIIKATNEGVLKKLCIEQTRSGGFHVYAKFAKVSNKITIAAAKNGSEVISIYTGGLLSFCSPTPGYDIVHNDFTDISELDQDEFDMLCSAADYFNEYHEEKLTAENKVITYPVEYESTALQFDTNCTDNLFEHLLNSIDLYETKRHGKQKHIPYLRKGSVAAFSAKVYYQSKKCLIFSGSFLDFPNFHNKLNENDTSWILTPTKILFYKNKRDWNKTLSDISTLSKEFDIAITPSSPVTNQPLLSEERLKFPYDIFPEVIQQYIFAQSIQHEYLAGAILGAVSSCIGNTAILEAMEGYYIKPVLFMAIVAPPGASKSPALTKSFAVLEDYDNDLFKQYIELREEYKIKLAQYDKDKKANEKPEEPALKQVLIKDSTIEMVVKILSTNTTGCCILADELAGFLNRMNQYKGGDEVQKWLEMWSGSPILLQRISRGHDKVQNPFCSIIGGIQPGVLEMLSKEENQHNGFYHRFLFVYPKPDNKRSWEKITIPARITVAFKQLFIDMLRFRSMEQITYTLEPETNEIYRLWFDNKNIKYNKSTNDNVKGIIAKYQDYCLRFALIIQVIEDAGYRPGSVSPKAMERAIRLTEYFLGNMHKAIKILAPESPVDKLNEHWTLFYNNLPVNFSTKTAVTTGVTFGIKESSVKMFIGRNKNILFSFLERNSYEKMF